MRYYLVAGEASGDLHGSNLLKALTVHDPEAQFCGWGGDRMAAAGMHLHRHIRQLAFMGFAEVVQNLPAIMRNFRTIKSDILAFRPDVLILIDYPGFNLRLLKWAKSHGLRVVYYISPQLWAWHEGRVKQIRQYVDRMLVILPFEVDFYHKHGVEAHFVGHPLLDALDGLAPDPAFRSRYSLDSRPILALLPGSRRQEIQRMLPVMATLAARFPEHQCVVAGLSGHGEAFYRKQMRQAPLRLAIDSTYQLLLHADAAAVTSGTATLETALVGVPQVVCYRGGRISYAIGKRLVRVPFIALVNLIMEREVVQELIQGDFTPAKLEAAMKRLVQTEVKNHIETDYTTLREKLGGAGASDRAAQAVLELLQG